MIEDSSSLINKGRLSSKDLQMPKSRRLRGMQGNSTSVIWSPSSARLYAGKQELWCFLLYIDVQVNMES